MMRKQGFLMSSFTGLNDNLNRLLQSQCKLLALGHFFSRTMPAAASSSPIRMAYGILSAEAEANVFFNLRRLSANRV